MTDQPGSEIYLDQCYYVYDAHDREEVARFRRHADAEWYVKMREVKK